MAVMLFILVSSVNSTTYAMALYSAWKIKISVLIMPAFPPAFKVCKAKAVLPATSEYAVPIRWYNRYW